MVKVSIPTKHFIISFLFNNSPITFQDLNWLYNTGSATVLENFVRIKMDLKFLRVNFQNAFDDFLTHFLSTEVSSCKNI